MDVSEPDSVNSRIQQIIEENDALDGLVYCAGIGGSRPLSMLTPEKLDTCLRTNLYGFIECVHACTKNSYFHPGMSIVGVSSVAAIICDKGQTAYSASKAGMNGAMRSMSVELAEQKIRINTVVPGMIDTGMYGAFLNKYDEQSNVQLLKRQYLGIGTPDNVASVIAFLLSSAARCITGACIPVDGGYTSG